MGKELKKDTKKVNRILKKVEGRWKKWKEETRKVKGRSYLHKMKEYNKKVEGDEKNGGRYQKG